jgi:hypothetical protein
MLPRLIVAAILVNLSYFICAIGIEISNLLGSSIDSMLDAIVAGTNLGSGGNPQTDLISFEGAVMGLLFIGAGAGAAAALIPLGVEGALSTLLPVLVMAAFAIFVTIAVLVARQAFIIFLVVLSPLAFVAYLLPNTEGLYKKWVKGFMVMLLFYPLVILLYSGSQIAAAILRGASSSPLLEVFSLGVQVIPLFAMPFLFKIAGGVLNRFAGIVNNPNKGPFDLWRKSAEEAKERAVARSQARASGRIAKGGPEFKGGKFRRRAKRAAFGAFTTKGKMMKEVDHEREKKAAEREKILGGAGYFANRAESDPEYLKKIAGSSMFGAADEGAVARVSQDARETLLSLKKKETEGHLLSLNRNGSTLATLGYTANAQGEVRDKNGGLSNAAERKTNAGIEGELDLETIDALKYATSNNLTHTDTGLKALATSLAKTGNLDSKLAGALVNAKDAHGQPLDNSTKTYITQHINDEARAAGLNHLAYNTVDASGNFVPGGQFGGLGVAEDPATGQPTGVVNRLRQNGVSSFTKEMYSDPTIGPELARVADNLERLSPDAFNAELVKMDPRKIEYLVEAKVKAGIIPDTDASKKLAKDSLVVQRAEATKELGVTN